MHLNKIKIIAAGFPKGDIRMISIAPKKPAEQQEMLKHCAEQDATKTMVFFLMDGYTSPIPSEASSIIKPNNGEINRLGGKN